MLAMAASDQDSQQIGFPLGQRIEVLQCRKAVRGSWQPATIVMVKDGRRGIEYSEGSDLERLRESFSVMKDSGRSSTDYLRRYGKTGFLRPSPPHYTSKEQETWLKGLFVDAFEKGAWWEGVLLEDIKDADTMLSVQVLFPDQDDDERMVDIRNLRVSQQWDESTGFWNFRGYWKGLSSSGDDGKDTSYQEIRSLTIKPCKAIAHQSKHLLEDAEALPVLSNKKNNAFAQEFKELVNEKRNTARDYLFSMGYILEFHQRVGRGREAVYISPTGRRFYSLTKACKAWKREHGMASNPVACKSREARLLNIYDIYEGSSCFVITSSSKRRENKAVEKSGFPKMQRAIVQGVELRCLSDPQVTQSSGNTNPLDHGHSCTKVQHICGRKRPSEQWLQETHATHSHHTSLEPKKKRGRKPRLAENFVSESLINIKENKKAKQRRKPRHDGSLPVTEDAIGLCKSKAKCGHKPRVNLCMDKHDTPFRVSFFPVLDRRNRKKGKKTSHKFVHDNGDYCSPVSTITEAITSPQLSLSNCDAVNLQVEGNAKVDDICSACGDGGDLVLCDHCPSTYHAECAGLDAIPEGLWYCFSCCCASCEGFLFDTDNSSMPVLTCEQCEKRYHVNCSPREGRHGKGILGNFFWFCGMSCEQIHIGLHRHLGVSCPLDSGGLSWVLVKSNQGESLCRTSKLHRAYAVLQECFVPMVDIPTGVNVISQAVYSRGSQLVRLNCLGFYTLILERGCEAITVATFRIHGSRLAEMPFIGTRFRYRRKGMCWQLMCVLEKILEEVGVRNLLLPAVPQLLKTWRGKFNFQHINSWDRMEMMHMNLMRFPGTTILKKHVIKSHCDLHARSKSALSIDLSTIAQETSSLLSDGSPIGGGSELKSFKKSRTKVEKPVMDFGDGKVITATTKFKRVVKSSQWYVDSMKALCSEAEILRNKGRSRTYVPWEKENKELSIAHKEKRRRGRPPGSAKIRLKIKEPDHGIGDGARVCYR